MKMKKIAALVLAMSMATTAAAPAFAYSALNPDGTVSDAWKKRGATSIYDRSEQLKMIDALTHPKTESATWKHPTLVNLFG